MAAKVIPDKTVELLVRRGLNDREIAEVLGDEFSIYVTPNAITAWRRRNGDDLRRLRYEELIPWRVKAEHSILYPVKVLRWEARRRAGLDLAPTDASRLEAYKAKLDAAFDGRGGVIHYDPDTEQGWFVVERRPGIDVDMIRNPDVP